MTDPSLTRGDTVVQWEGTAQERRGVVDVLGAGMALVRWDTGVSSTEKLTALRHALDFRPHAPPKAGPVFALLAMLALTACATPAPNATAETVRREQIAAACSAYAAQLDLVAARVETGAASPVETRAALRAADAIGPTCRSVAGQERAVQGQGSAAVLEVVRAALAEMIAARGAVQ